MIYWGKLVYTYRELWHSCLCTLGTKGKDHFAGAWCGCFYYSQTLNSQVHRIYSELEAAWENQLTTNECMLMGLYCI